MRISIDKDDPGYREDAANFTVFVDGKKQTDVVTADSGMGMVTVIDMVAFRQGKRALFTRHGVVEIRGREQTLSVDSSVMGTA